ncbi:DNA cytosine methyltransferase [Asticcacaulis sp. DW145]|uniref:DNA cytosine methyltransferase n=1 Tax=Asticcacaulis sp. DW145 TaxID=3095608 RepID=UPI003087A6DF|nr:DNA cytosine methyltransferase [Asticcacaulis sp. DW145]
MAFETGFSQPITAVDLFCGAGGLTHGLILESIAVRAGIDIDGNCKFAYEENNDVPFIAKDVSLVTGSELKALFGASSIKVLAGCAPCQPFSRYTQGKDTSEDTKWGMLYEFGRLIKEIQPEIVTMENVPEVRRHQVYEDFEAELKTLGYQVSSDVVFCPDYGIPQNRSRLVLLASKLGPIQLAAPTHNSDTYRTVRETISHLEPINAGEASATDHLHLSAGMSDLNLQRIKASVPDGTWQDWDDDLVAACHRKEGRTTYRSVYGRMSWDKPSPTITTQFTGFGNGRFGHPTQDRGLSLREGALLQTFPATYRFTEPGKPVIIKHISKMIGNAVPVQLGRVIARSIKEHLAGQNVVRKVQDESQPERAESPWDQSLQ